MTESKSSDQGEYMLVKDFDPGRGWFYRHNDSDYPLNLSRTYEIFYSIVTVLYLEFSRLDKVVYYLTVYTSSLMNYHVSW